MTCYVDDVRHRFGRMVMCHLWADTTDELHEMAAAIGVKRLWFQTPPKASWEHYDISLSMKDRARHLGAVLTDRYGPVMHTASLSWNVKMYLTVLTVRERNGTPLDGIIG